MSQRTATSAYAWGFVLLVGVLLSIGLIMLTSASMSVAEGNTGRPFL